MKKHITSDGEPVYENCSIPVIDVIGFHDGVMGTIPYNAFELIGQMGLWAASETPTVAVPRMCDDGFRERLRQFMWTEFLRWEKENGGK